MQRTILYGIHVHICARSFIRSHIESSYIDKSLWSNCGTAAAAGETKKFAMAEMAYDRSCVMMMPRVRQRLYCVVKYSLAYGNMY